jgi:hypothetical protein
MTTRRLFLLLPLVALAAPARATTSERVVLDRATGLALGGVDPVTYFTTEAPLLGRGDLEARWAGVVWRFTSAANRAAFLEAPEAYAPCFGGHDPVAAARGRIAEGDPHIYLVVHSEDSRGLLEAHPNLAVEAEQVWPRLVASLSR